MSCAVLLESADGSDGGRSPTGRARLSSRGRWSGEAQVNALMAVLEERAVLGRGTESSSEWRVSVVGDGESGV